MQNDDIDKTILTNTAPLVPAGPKASQKADTPNTATAPIVHPPGKRGHDDSTAETKTTRTVFWDIFQKDEVETESISLGADPSLDFRRQLEISEKRYKLEKRIASGGFGHIFLAEDRVLGRKVVVKTLKEEFLNNPVIMERFISEAKLNAQLDHPAIVPLYSLNTDSRDGLHLSMQLIRGITLKEYLTRSRELQLQHHYSQTRFAALVRERLELFLHICDAIEYCHSRGVIHNDLKPDNVMIGRYGEVYVMDWGIACPEGQKPKGGNAGTPSYMAPERIRDRVVSRLTDIFALGMILNELVTLRPPLSGANADEVVSRICEGNYEPSLCVDPRRKITPALRAIIEKARHPDQEQRYPSVRQLSADVRHYLFNEEVKAYPDSLFQKLMRYLYRHRAITLTIVILFTLLYAATIFYGFYKENRLTQAVNEQMYRNLRLQTSVERVGEEIDSRIVPLKEQAQSISGALMIECNQKKSYPKNEPVYWNDDFPIGSANRPPGLIHAESYNGDAVTLRTGVFYKTENLPSPEEIQLWANRFGALRSQHLATILGSINKDGFSGEKPDIIKQFHEYGAAIRRIICIADGKLIYTYPGKHEANSVIMDFLQDDVRRDQAADGNLVWSAPYLDSSGHVIIACWYSIFNIRGRKIGSIGFEISYLELLQPLFEQEKKEKGKTIYTLVDAEDRLIFSSQPDKPEAQNGKEALQSMIGHEAYRIPEVLYRIRRPDAPPQFTIRLGGKPYRISWTRIPSTGWLLIQHVAADEIETLDAESETDQRNELRRDILRNMKKSRGNKR